MSVAQTDKIFELFKPYIKNKSDIIDLKKIDEILDNNKEILLKYSNLWYSYEVIKEILGDNIYNHYENKLKRLRQNFKIFVWCKQYEEVLKKIDEENIFIISGAPGVGKSTLANMLCVMYLYKGYEVYDFSLEKIDEVYKVIRQNSYENKKTLIFLDDFLGHVILDYFGSNDNGNSLLAIIKEIKNNPNIKLIATSRASILNEANEKSEKFREFNLNAEKRKMVIRIDDYSIQEKALILYKHLKRSKLKKDFLKEFVDNKTYVKVINHKNYSPRIIEYIVNEEYAENITGKYSDYVLENLSKPINLWGKSFENLSNDLKILFISLCSFRREVSKDLLEEAYYSRENELENKIGSFGKNLKILEGSFFKINNRNKKIYVDVINPSLRDFFIVKLNEENRLYKKIIKSALDIEQIKYIQELRNDKKECMEFILNCGILNKFEEKILFDFYKINLKKNYGGDVNIKIEENLFIYLREADNKSSKGNNYGFSDLLEIKNSHIILEKNRDKINEMILNSIESGGIQFTETSDYHIIVNLLLEYNKINWYLDILETALLTMIEFEVEWLDYNYCFHEDFEYFEINCIDYIFESFDNISEELYTEENIKEMISTSLRSLEKKHFELCMKNKNKDKDKETELDIELERARKIEKLFEKIV
ncbi:AAA family ATPase [Cetobacterium somerae]|uniref:nSTAND3 domain-containing NTPase n=1 Tax=Cetobacterium somerae TaxID=188913 RepID=UPI00211F0780|nr:AAA family ATPase [Cetobacterium somerae]MCQ9628484.1 AAA family ATPase [Cetobacterium somerae]